VIRIARACETAVMSVAHLTPPVAAPSLHSAIGALRARGMRVSSARRSILEALYDADAPLTADELAGDGDVASVYRNLDALEGLGLVRHVHAGHGPGRYTIIGASGEVEFLACERCQTIEAVDPARLDAARALIERELGLRARFTHFPIVGLCERCTTTSDDGFGTPQMT
jgi:Fur family ferric uptake transcriptional regulator